MKYITFSATIKEKPNNCKIITQKLKFVDIVLDLCQANYRTLSIIYLKFIPKSVTGAKKRKISN